MIFSSNNLNYFSFVGDNRNGDGYYFWPSVISYKNIKVNFLVGKNVRFSNSVHADFEIDNSKLLKMLKIFDKIFKN